MKLLDATRKVYFIKYSESVNLGNFVKIEVCNLCSITTISYNTRTMILAKGWYYESHDREVLIGLRNNIT